MTNDVKLKAIIERSKDIISDYEDGILDLNDTLTYLLENRRIADHVDGDDAHHIMACIDTIVAKMLIAEANDIDPAGFVTFSDTYRLSWEKE